jgi:hypothetical protein
MQMQKTMVYLPKQLKERVLVIANSQGTSQANVIRKALEEGLGTASFQSNASAQGLIKIGQLAQKLQAKGPSDLSENLDHYTWDE